MKKVFYLRHAKSSWDEALKPDIERKLNARGRRDSPVMAQKLQEYLELKNISLESILCSVSKRTTETIEIFTSTNFKEVGVSYDPSLYHSSSEYLLECLFGLDDNIETVLVCSHNPGISHLAYDIGIQSGNIPTCGIFECTFNTDSWMNVSVDNAKGGIFIYPKKYRDENT